MHECKCGHEREAHDMDKDLNFTGKCLMKDDGCKCKHYEELSGEKRDD